MRILIVESDPNLRLLWRGVMQARGFEVVEVETVKRAAAEIGKRLFDLAILDFCAGGDAALVLASELSCNDPPCEIVVVAGSHRLDPGAVTRAIPAVRAILHKPVDLEEVVSVCDSALSSQMPKETSHQRAL